MTLAPILFVLARSLNTIQNPPPPGPPPPPGLSLDSAMVFLFLLALLYGVFRKIIIVKTKTNG